MTTLTPSAGGNDSESGSAKSASPICSSEPQWNPATHPYVLSWSFPTGERLTRFISRQEYFATEECAVAGLRKMASGAAKGMVWRSTGLGTCRVIYTRTATGPVRKCST